jgi:tellurite resistance protein TerA
VLAQPQRLPDLGRDRPAGLNMVVFTRGQKARLADLGLSTSFPVTLDISGAGITVDVSCFGLDANGKLSDDRYMVFYNQKSTPDGSIVLEQQGSRAIFRVNLERLPPSIDKLVFTAAVSGGGGGGMSAIGNSSITLGDPPAAVFNFSGADFVDEKAVIVGELYRREGSWRFGAVGQGFAGGLSALLKHFGGTEVAEAPKPVSLSKITLEKRGDKVSLDKRAGQGYGRIRINLNWHQGPPAKEGGGLMGKLFGKPGSGGIDLDLGCLYEMRDGKRGAIQALGESWGAYDRPPYIHLDKDDRTGSVAGGENIYINGDHFDELRRVLVYAFIYSGVPNWAATDAVVTIEIPGQPTVEVRLDNGKQEPMCAIAMLENQNGKLQVTKLVEYFGSTGTMSAHQAMDERFGFGLNWKRGSKN